MASDAEQSVDQSFTVRAILLLIGGSYLIPLVVVFGVWLIFFHDYPFELVPLGALVLSPTLWLAVVFAVLLERYLASARKAVKRGYAVDDRLLGRLTRAYYWREDVTRTIFAPSVFLGYAIVAGGLRSAGIRGTLNPHNSASEEIPYRSRRRLDKQFLAICDFALLNQLSMSRAALRRSIDAVHDAVPYEPLARQFRPIALAIFSDGDGISSTLTMLTYTHFASLLPFEAQKFISDSLARMHADIMNFGWLGGRVVEALVYITTRDVDAAARVAHLIERVRVTSSRLSLALDDTARDAIKWQVRNQMRLSNGLQEL